MSWVFEFLQRMPVIQNKKLFLNASAHKLGKSLTEKLFRRTEMYLENEM